MRVKLPPLEEWQQPVFDDIKEGIKDQYVVKAKRQVGKSILAETILMYFAFKNADSIGVMIEPTLSQGRRVFKQILKAIPNKSLIKSANATLLEIEFSNGSSILFRAAEQKENLRGLTVKGSILIIDEAAFIQQDIFEILYPLVDANHCPVLFISTPLFTSGEFYNKYIEGTKENPITKSYNWSEYDTSKYLSYEKLMYYRDRLSPLKYRSEYEGEFITEGSYVFGEINNSIAPYSKKPALYGGLDWGAGGGNDHTVLILLDEDCTVTAIHSTNNLTPTLQVEYFSNILKNNPSLISLQVEMNSIGTVYKDMLQGRISTFIQEFYTTNDTKRRIIEQLIAAFQRGEIHIPNDPELLNELSHYNIEKTKTGYTYNGDGAHDDYVLALAFAYDSYLNGGGGFSIYYA